MCVCVCVGMRVHEFNENETANGSNQCVCAEKMREIKQALNK